MMDIIIVADVVFVVAYVAVTLMIVNQKCVHFHHHLDYAKHHIIQNYGSIS
jgi:hypothetical protein